MAIKKIVKFGFFSIMLFVIVIVFTEFIALHQIKRNSSNLKTILKIVSLQEDMNFLSNDLFLTKDKKRIDKIKDRFHQLEMEFEKTRDFIGDKKNRNFLDNFVDDILQYKEITKDLRKLYAHEKLIEKMFNDIYTLQKKKIKQMDKFETMYPDEKRLRNIINHSVSTDNKQNMMLRYANVGYYSKEVLFQKRDKESLDKWLNTIKMIKEVSDDKENVDKYYKLAQDIGKSAISIRNIKNTQQDLTKNITMLIRENRKLNDEIRDDIEKLSTSFIDRIYFYLMVMSVTVVVIILLITYNVNKNVGLTVDEVEKKIADGLREIKALNKEIEDTQREIVFKMGAIGERRSKETGNHVKRVAEYSKILGLYYGLPKKDCEILKEASPMHDIGKVAIPDSILNKPGKLNDEELKIMKTHAELGYEMLKGSNRNILKTASIVAHEHHEKWDGSGYPRGLKGEEIHIYGRITAVADVFDALGSDRVYKKAWEDEKIFQFFKEQSGKHFDPKLVYIFFEHIDEFLKIRDKFKDKID